jgi:hypothetical protein
MTIKPSRDVLVAHLSGEAVLLNLADKSYYRLNETAAMVWSSIEKGESRDTMLAALLKSYNVAEAIADNEIDEILAQFLQRKLITDLRSDS